MCKKLFFWGGGLALVAVLLFGREVKSYVSTSYNQVTDSVRDSFPVDFQIERARGLVSELKPVIVECRHVIAKEEVEINKLASRIESMESKNGKDKENILRLQSDLGMDKSVYRYAGRTYNASEVKEDLNRRFERFKTSDATLASLKQMREARERNLQASVKKLSTMESSQRQLEVEIENLRAKKQLVEVATASSDYKFDDSKLAKAKALIDQIHTDLDVTAKLANADVNYQGEIQLESTDTENVELEVAKYFGLEEAMNAKIANASYEK